MSGREEVGRLKKRLDATLSRAPTSSSDIECQADFAKYFCVLVSGFFENAIVALTLDFVERRSAPEVANFVETQLDRWTNANVDKLCKLIGSFDSDWRAQCEEFLVDERKESVNSLIALRHKIAHGESVSTSLSQVRAYYVQIAKVVDFLADLLCPQS